MELRQNKPLRDLGVYKLRDRTLVLFKRSEELAFLFSLEAWQLHGPVDCRESWKHLLPWRAHEFD